MILALPDYQLKLIKNILSKELLALKKTETNPKDIADLKVIIKNLDNAIERKSKYTEGKEL